MRILIYGECEQVGFGAWCYYDNLKTMGHDVDFYTRFEHINFYYSNILFRILRRLNRGALLEKHRIKHTRGFEEKVYDFKPEIVIVLKGLLLDKELIKRIRDTGVWIVQINHDDFFSRFKANQSKIQWEAVPEYNYIFCTKEINVKELRPFNPNVEMFLFSYYPKIHFPPIDITEKEKQRWKSDIVFVGSCYPERVKQLEYLVANVSLPIDLKIYGSGWDRLQNTSLTKFITNKYLGPDELRKTIYCSTISLGFLCKENRDDYTQRSFEIPASKGLLLAERTARHLEFYKEGTEAVFFNTDNYDELVHKTEMLLKDKQKAESIKINGYKKVISSHHTYADRLNRLIELYKNRNMLVGTSENSVPVN